MRVKYLVVGAGLTGLTVAERIANCLKENVLIVEKRGHIGGNAYDCYNADGILVHMYGPHIFHTDRKEIYDYLSAFTQWNDYQHRVLTYADGLFMPMPITLPTMNMLYGADFTCFEMERFLNERAVKIDPVTNSEEYILSKAGPDIYEKFFKNYTAKQWGVPASRLDPSVAARIPVRCSPDTRYFTDKYQGIPKNGYARMCENMTDNKKIKILLNTDYNEISGDIEYDCLIYTGPVDGFYGLRRGALRYRSLRFQFETIDTESYQDAAVVNYPNDYDYTRITEYKKITWQKHAKTSVVKEFPCDGDEPFYPYPTVENGQIYQKYKADAAAEKKVIFAGRLGEYKYYNMDEAIGRALDIFSGLQAPGKEHPP